MKEFIIFFIIFFAVFAVSLAIFNGRFIYAQLKYDFLGPAPVDIADNKNKIEKGLFWLPVSGSADNFVTLVIPSIGVNAPIVLSGNIDESLIQKDLEKGVVRYGNSNVILGHSSAYPWYKGNYGSVFSLLNKLQIGDEIYIYSNNKKYSYKVSEKQINSPKNISLQETTEDSAIYLVSCWPINTNWKRIAIKAIAIDK
jgi:LPXTG-site transpeptidase (sortase) family protein